MTKLYKIYRDYIRENKKYVLISLIISLRLEIFSSLITFFMFAIIETEVHSKIYNLMGYLIINSIIPIILSIKNLKKTIPYIENFCLNEYVKTFKLMVFLINFIVFSVTVTLVVTIAGEKLPLLIPFDIVRMTLLKLGYESIVNNSLLGI
ncbi:MAG: hypothetical protein ACOCNL_01265 [Acetivibrio ethanolgignens]